MHYSDIENASDMFIGGITHLVPGCLFFVWSLKLSGQMNVVPQPGTLQFFLATSLLGSGWKFARCLLTSLDPIVLGAIFLSAGIWLLITLAGFKMLN